MNHVYSMAIFWLASVYVNVMWCKYPFVRNFVFPSEEISKNENLYTCVELQFIIFVQYIATVSDLAIIQSHGFNAI